MMGPGPQRPTLYRAPLSQSGLSANSSLDCPPEIQNDSEWSQGREAPPNAIVQRWVQYESAPLRE